MKKYVTGLALVCATVMAVFTSATLAAPPQQLLVNGSFETGFTGWGTQDIGGPVRPARRPRGRVYAGVWAVSDGTD